MGEQQQTMSVPVVLGIASGAAAAVGVLLVALFERHDDRESSTPRGRARRLLETSQQRVNDETVRGRKRAGQEAKQTRKRFKSLERQMKHMDSKDMRREALRTVKESRKVAAERAAALASASPDLLERGRHIGDHARAAADEVVRRAPGAIASAEDRLQPALDSVLGHLPPAARETLSGARDAIGNAVSASSIKDAREQIQPIAEHIRHDADVLARSVAETAQSAARAFQERRGPLVHDVAETASAAIAAGRDTAAESRHRLQEDILPEAKAFGDRLVHAASDQSKALGGHLREAEEAIVDASHSARRQAETTGAVVEDRSRRVASAAGRGSRDLGSLVIWGSAAAGLAYFAFLDPDQREKVRAAGARVYAEGKSIFNELKGIDGEFR